MIGISTCLVAWKVSYFSIPTWDGFYSIVPYGRIEWTGGATHWMTTTLVPILCCHKTIRINHRTLTRRYRNEYVLSGLSLLVGVCIFFFPQQCKPMGSSAQNSSGVHWCRRRVRFNEVPEKVPKVPEKVPGNLGAKLSQVQQGSGESSGEGLGGFGAEPGEVQQLWRRFRRRSGRLWCKAWCKARWKRFRRRFREALVQSQVRFSRVPKKVPEKVWEALVQSQVRFNRVLEKVPEKVWEAWSRVRSGSTGFAGI